MSLHISSQLFLKNMEEAFQNPENYLHIDALKKTASAPKGAFSKERFAPHQMLVGEIALSALECASDYSPREIEKIKQSLIQLKTRITDKRSQFNLLTRIYLSVKSAFYNCYSGFGLYDSIYLINSTIKNLDKMASSHKIQMEGSCILSPKEQDALMKIFSKKSMDELSKQQKQEKNRTWFKVKLTIDNQELDVNISFTYPTREERNFKESPIGFEFTTPSIPNTTFFILDDKAEARHRLLLSAKSAADSLDCVVIPQFSLIHLTESGQAMTILAEQKPDHSNQATLKRDTLVNFESSQVSTVFNQLTQFICQTGFSHLSALSFHEKDGKLVASIDELGSLSTNNTALTLIGGFKSSISGFTSKPVFGLMNYFPHYASTIYETAKTQRLDKWTEKVKKEFDKAKENAEKVIEREKEVKLFHEQKQINLHSPAISADALASLNLLDPPKGTTWEAIVQKINEAVAKQAETYDQLGHIREFSLNPYPAEKDKDEQEAIIKILIPHLKNLGMIQGFYNQWDIERLGLNVRHPYAKLLIQF